MSGYNDRLDPKNIEQNITQLNENYGVSMSRSDFKAYILDAFKCGIEAFAWMKDGVSYVGTTGMTLKEALKMADEGKVWNQPQ